MKDYIEIKNARIHNLKNIDIKIPKGMLTVITGVSGSGKSSLAFDTLYEEGKRRYLMFSGTQVMLDSVSFFDSITGLSPTVAVEQRVVRQSNPRSTVGTRTKISAMLAALFAAYGACNGDYDGGLPLSMEMFQKNSPRGMCIKCLGVGKVKKFDDEKLFEDKTQKIADISFGLARHGSTKRMLDSFCKRYMLSPEQVLASLTDEQLSFLKYGDGGLSFMGYIPWITRIINGIEGASGRSGRLEYLMEAAGTLQKIPCPKCGGSGLGEQASHTTLEGRTITQYENMYIKELQAAIRHMDARRSTPLHREIITKLACLEDVGLQHLTLSRPVPTLSGGEIQRLFLASYIIAEMDAIIFVFDEPTIGLHEAEKAKLISIIRNLVDRGNTVVAVEHDENFMLHADYIVDLGPGAGALGGERVFQGTLSDFLTCASSTTAPYLADKQQILLKKVAKTVDYTKLLRIGDANLHNLQNVSVDIPLGLMVGIAGVSGSGKSSLITDSLVPKLMEMLKNRCLAGDGEDMEPLHLEAALSQCNVDGVHHIKRCYVIDQRPIGRSRTSCPATYTGVFDRIRGLFARIPEAMERGCTMGLFSVYSEGGCKNCKGDGVIYHHIGFGNFMEIQCESCGGTGYVPEALGFKLDGKTIYDALAMTVDEAIPFFAGKDKRIQFILQTLQRVGMGYIKLGQKTPTISGGESQRIKLAKELAKGKNAKDALYILDEPTTGLSLHDTKKLLALMQELVDGGNTVIVTEHDPYVLSSCDYIIEMGVGGGSAGGSVIAMGSPQSLKANENSIIGRYLR